MSNIVLLDEAWKLSARYAAHAIHGRTDDREIETIMVNLHTAWQSGQAVGLQERMALVWMEAHTTIPNFGQLQQVTPEMFLEHIGAPGQLEAIEEKYSTTSPAPELATRRGPVLKLKRQWRVDNSPKKQERTLSASLGQPAPSSHPHPNPPKR